VKEVAEESQVLEKMGRETGLEPATWKTTTLLILQTEHKWSTGSTRDDHASKS
jgi:hypothetical protein